MTDLMDASLNDAQLSAKIEFYANKPYNGGLTIDAKNNLYLTEIGKHRDRHHSAGHPGISRYVPDPDMIWPDGVTYNSDGSCTGSRAVDPDRGLPEQCAPPARRTMRLRTGSIDSGPRHRERPGHSGERRAAEGAPNMTSGPRGNRRRTRSGGLDTIAP